MAQKVSLTGNDAGATALRQVNPDVAAVFPITPQTELMHLFAEFVANGIVDTNLVAVESEHSAMSATLGAAAAGARAVTATSSQGLALMWEIVYITSSLRLPVVMPVVNRALSGPINIHCDHSDTMGCRDSGWIQIFSENAQEVYDNVIQAFRIGEHHSVLLPVMVTLDGFILSHTMETLELLPDEVVKKFVGEYQPMTNLLNVDSPISVGPLHLPDFYFEAKRQQAEAMKVAHDVILEVGRDFESISGRGYGFFEGYRLDDADVAVVVLGSAAGTAKDAADELRNDGIKAGVLKLRVYRPFPGPEIANALKHVKAIAVMDRSCSFGLEGGPVFNEVRSATYDYHLKLTSYIYGLGGRDITVSDIKGIFADQVQIVRTGRIDRLARFIGVRE
jgi:pyruvate ferredoxin oxidoreductase alpha subunit